ncbi:MAG: hypothetical protein JWR44_3485 [Hymenobacter sp.]|jgi:hypothetical protein|nr:hypothetical protein [Hymenobacter sp.]
MKGAQVPTWVWAVLVGTHVLALGWALSRDSWSFPDSGRYLQAAENLRMHGVLYAKPWLGYPPKGAEQAMQEFTIRTVGYPLVVATTGVGDGRPILLLLLQNLLSVLSIGAVLRWWARERRPQPADWKFAVGGVLFFPAQLVYPNAVMSETLLQTAVVLMMTAGLFFVKTHKRRYFAGAAAALVLAFLLKPVFYPLSVVFAGVGLWAAWRQRRPQLLVMGVLPLLVAGLYMEWNQQRTGYFHFSSIAEINLLHYNAAGAVREVEGPAAEELWVASVLREANAQPDFAARQQLIQARAEEKLQTHALVYARQHAQGMAALFLDPGRFDLGQFLRLPQPKGGGLLSQVRSGDFVGAMRRLPLAMLGVLGLVLLANVARLVLAVRGFRALKNQGTLHFGRWIAAGLLFYVALLTGPLGAARFLVPVWPLLFGLALMGLPQRNGLQQKSDSDQTPPTAENQR